MRAYGVLFTFRGVPRLVVALTVTRLAAPVLNLSLLLAVVAVQGSYLAGGLALTGFAVALALFVPVSARLVDRLGPRPVLVSTLLLHFGAYALTLIAMSHHAPASVLIGGAVALGASNPPASPVIRSTWPVVLPARHTRAAFALDAVLNEVMVVMGALVVSALVAATSPVITVAMAGVGTCAGILILLSMPDRVREDAPAPRRRLLGPLGSREVRVLLGITACDMLAFGCVLVGVTAVATTGGVPELSGVLLGAYSFGVVVSALGFGTRQRDPRPRRQLATLHAASAVLLVVTGLVPGFLLNAALLVVVGLVAGPRDALHQVVLGDVAAPEHRAEAFAWMSTFMWLGNGIGTALAGRLLAEAGGAHRTTFLAAAAAAVAAAGLSLFLGPVLRAAGALPPGRAPIRPVGGTPRSNWRKHR
ncbi:MFS transporter [Amycolatopsis samaneae]|uniref:MFS transporter n=1 Tax=Amycolatopsis samaneae TaxID=664691 RepID=A0ABW5GJL8_9PSEU